MRTLIMGGTRFIGVYLSKILVDQGHEVVLFNRGNHPPAVPGLAQIHGDRTDAAQLQDKLAHETFDAIFDNNGRKLTDTQPLAQLFKGRVQHFIYMSSAGVYLQSDQMPHREDDPTDPKSRHLGKAESEADLVAQGLPFTAIRPTYIYGPQNYNDLEAWFFESHRSRSPHPNSWQWPPYDPVWPCSRLGPSNGIHPRELLKLSVKSTISVAIAT